MTGAIRVEGALEITAFQEDASQLIVHVRGSREIPAR
jgi:hypothetical protein